MCAGSISGSGELRDLEALVPPGGAGVRAINVSFGVGEGTTARHRVSASFSK